MVPTARIIGVSLLTAGLGAGLAGAFLGQNSRDYGLGNTLSGGPPYILGIEKNSKTIRHRAGIYSDSVQNASASA